MLSFHKNRGKNPIFLNKNCFNWNPEDTLARVISGDLELLMYSPNTCGCQINNNNNSL